MKVTKQIIDALDKKWPNLSAEGFDEDEAAEIIESILAPIKSILIHADSELSAIRHGRPPSDKKELEDLYYGIRGHVEG